MKSANHLEERTKRKKGESSKDTKPQAVWKMIWDLKIPNSAKMLFWRACKNILPTKDNLKKRKVLVEDSCNFCLGAIETAQLILWECPSSQDVWSVSDRQIQKRTTGGGSFIEMVVEMMEFLNREEMESFVMTAKWI